MLKYQANFVRQELLEAFWKKTADRQTERQTDTSTDNKARLKPSARVYYRPRRQRLEAFTTGVKIIW